MCVHVFTYMSMYVGAHECGSRSTLDVLGTIHLVVVVVEERTLRLGKVGWLASPREPLVSSSQVLGLQICAMVH